MGSDSMDNKLYYFLFFSGGRNQLSARNRRTFQMTGPKTDGRTDSKAIVPSNFVCRELIKIQITFAFSL